jgi:hypothetical protein
LFAPKQYVSPTDFAEEAILIANYGSIIELGFLQMWVIGSLMCFKKTLALKSIFFTVKQIIYR